MITWHSAFKFDSTTRRLSYLESEIIDEQVLDVGRGGEV